MISGPLGMIPWLQPQFLHPKNGDNNSAYSGRGLKGGNGTMSVHSRSLINVHAPSFPPLNTLQTLEQTVLKSDSVPEFQRTHFVLFRPFS